MVHEEGECERAVAGRHVAREAQVEVAQRGAHAKLERRALARRLCRRVHALRHLACAHTDRSRLLGAVVSSLWTFVKRLVP